MTPAKIIRLSNPDSIDVDLDPDGWVTILLGQGRHKAAAYLTPAVAEKLCNLLGYAMHETFRRTESDRRDD